MNPLWLRTTLLALSLVAGRAWAVDLTIGYPVLEQAIREGLFDDHGRYYVKGGPADDCAYAFLEQPRLGAAEGRLALTLHFNGRAGAMILGKCVGPGDAFEVTLTGVPRLDGGVLSLADPRFTLPSRPAYEQLLAPLLTGAIAESLRIDLGAEIERFTQAAAQGGYRVAITNLAFTDVRLAEDRVEVTLDFTGGVTR
jgi:hypothetical protein